MNIIELRDEGEPAPTVINILRTYLENNNYDGLCGDECGCPIDDLRACDESFSHCKPGYKRKPTQEEIEEYGECEWIMSTRKEDKDAGV